ncbi:MAG: hypothetical protein R3E12_03035 [Candidatus Eisenbacteria bacterium]
MVRTSLLALAMLLATLSRAHAGELRLDGHTGNTANNPPHDRAELLFHGDLTPEIGIGCSDSLAIAGGPNFTAVKVTARLTPPFLVTSLYYNIFTNVSPNPTEMTFVIYQGGDAPGPIIQQTALVAPHSLQGDHTIAIGGLAPDSQQFYFGMIQPNVHAGMRWGVDTAASDGTSFFRAPSCGLDEFVTLDTIGFPGNWVMAITVDNSYPVELMTWGSVKATYAREIP